MARYAPDGAPLPPEGGSGLQHLALAERLFEAAHTLAPAEIASVITYICRYIESDPAHGMRAALLFCRCQEMQRRFSMLTHPSGQKLIALIQEHCAEFGNFTVVGED